MADSLTNPGRPTWLQIDTQAVVDNFRLAQKKCGAEVKVFPVVKADGYGLGAVPLSHALVVAGAPGLCVGLVEEGEQLREAGIRVPLVLFAGLTPGTEQKIIDLDLTPFLYDLQSAKALNRVALAGKVRVTCAVKVDTGMGRIGFPHATFAETLRRLQTLSGIRISGIVSHLACGDEGDDGSVSRDQIARMRSVLALEEVKKIDARLHSLANSAGILYHPDSHLNWVRPGIMLYGASPAFPRRSFAEDGLFPVVRWLSRIIQIRSVAAGTSLGYGHTYTSKEPMIIAQIPVGYGDGYSRHLSNRGHVLIAGRKAPIVGRVCMDLTTVDVTAIPNVESGSLVTLLGEDGEEFIGIEDMARWMETIPYEVICGLSKRVPRHYVDS